MEPGLSSKSYIQKTNNPINFLKTKKQKNRVTLRVELPHPLFQDKLPLGAHDKASLLEDRHNNHATRRVRYKDACSL